MEKQFILKLLPYFYLLIQIQCQEKKIYRRNFKVTCYFISLFYKIYFKLKYNNKRNDKKTDYSLNFRVGMANVRKTVISGLFYFKDIRYSLCFKNIFYFSEFLFHIFCSINRNKSQISKFQFSSLTVINQLVFLSLNAILLIYFQN